MNEKINILINNYKNNKNNSKVEIKIHNLKFLEQYRNDDLYFLINTATERGYNGIEWIDFNGIGGIDINICVKWVYERIEEQKLGDVIEPYYNNVNKRLGIIIIRNILKKINIEKNSICLPLELQNKKKKIVKIETIKEENIDNEEFIKLNSCIITNPNYESKKKKSRIRRFSNKVGNKLSSITNILTKSFSGSSISSITSVKSQTPKE
jgi:hypothetical protein